MASWGKTSGERPRAVSGWELLDGGISSDAGCCKSTVGCCSVGSTGPECTASDACWLTGTDCWNSTVCAHEGRDSCSTIAAADWGGNSRSEDPRCWGSKSDTDCDCSWAVTIIWPEEPTCDVGVRSTGGVKSTEGCDWGFWVMGTIVGSSKGSFTDSRFGGLGYFGSSWGWADTEMGSVSDGVSRTGSGLETGFETGTGAG